MSAACLGSRVQPSEVEQQPEGKDDECITEVVSRQYKCVFITVLSGWQNGHGGRLFYDLFCVRSTLCDGDVVMVGTL